MLFLATLLVPALATLELNDENFDAVTKNGSKGAFVKFLAPWWGHCKSMKPDWDKLAEEYKDSPLVTIADVDCTAAGENLCSRENIEGFPTIRYYLVDSPKAKDYSGGRNYAGLKSFVDKTFKPGCDVNTKENCDEDQTKIIDSYAGKSKDEIAAILAETTDNKNAKYAARLQFIEDGKVKLKEMKAEEAELGKQIAILSKLAGPEGAPKEEL